MNEEIKKLEEKVEVLSKWLLNHLKETDKQMYWTVLHILDSDNEEYF